MTLLRVYIDGFNLYHAIEKQGDPRLKWLNMQTLAKGFLREGEALDEVHFFTAVWRFDMRKQKRHENYIAALEAYGVTVHRGNFSKPRRWCEKHERNCPFREEKQTDVAIAVRMITDAADKELQRHVLVTADSDQIPTIKALSAFSNVNLTLAYPPGRSREARELGGLVTDRFELSSQRLLTCMLPRTVSACGKTVATMPAIYVENA
jgi:uncharacterized LabA/DUF88 family protein